MEITEVIIDEKKTDNFCQSQMPILSKYYVLYSNSGIYFSKSFSIYTVTFLFVLFLFCNAELHLQCRGQFKPENEAKLFKNL